MRYLILKLLAGGFLSIVSLCIYAENNIYNAGKAVGQFGSGISSGLTENLQQNLDHLQPEWITVAPKSKAICLKQSDGELNKIYMRCRNGWQEYVRYTPDGKKIILSERQIPIYP